MGYTSSYAQNEISKSVSSKQDKPDKKKKKALQKGEVKFTRKEAKDAKAKRGEGHAIKGMSVRKIKKNSGKASF